MGILVLYFLFLAVMLIFAFAMLGTLFADAPFVPTGRRDVQKILETVSIKSGESVYDLGSGDGRVVRAAARLGARAVGVEQSRIMVVWSRLVEALPPKFRRQGLRIFSARFIRGNFLEVDLAPADIIFCYLLPDAMAVLKDKFMRELQPGARVISRAFTIPGLVPSQVLRFGKRKMPVYVYII